MRLFTFLLAAVALLATIAHAQRDHRGCCEDYCYDTDNERPQAKRMGTKTAYEFVRGSESVRQFYVPSEYKTQETNVTTI